MSKLEDKLDLQYVGGRYDTVPKLLKDYPDLKTRWTYEELTRLNDLLGELEMVGFRHKKGAQLLQKYLELRGDEGNLVHCVDYSTSEYCVMLKIWRNEQYRMRAQQNRLIETMRRDGFDADSITFREAL